MDTEEEGGEERATNVLDKVFGKQGSKAQLAPKNMYEDTRKILEAEVNKMEARKYAGRKETKEIHAELNTLPRCAKHGTVIFYFVLVDGYVSKDKAVSLIFFCSIFLSNME